MATRDELIKMYTEPSKYYGEERVLRINGVSHMVGGKADKCYVATFGYYGMIGTTICRGTAEEVADALISRYGESSLVVVSKVDPCLVNGL